MSLVITLWGLFCVQDLQWKSSSGNTFEMAGGDINSYQHLDVNYIKIDVILGKIQVVKSIFYVIYSIISFIDWP